MPSVENLQTAKTTAFEEIATQVSTGAALDAKLVGLLAFMAAAVGVLLTVAQGLLPIAGYCSLAQPARACSS